MLRVLILLTTVALLGSAAAAEECSRETMREGMERWDRTADRITRPAIAEALRPCMERQGIPWRSERSAIPPRRSGARRAACVRP